MTSNGIQGSFNAHDTLTVVLNEAQKAGQKHVYLTSGDWHQVAQATRGQATRLEFEGEVILLFKGYWFHEHAADPNALKEEGYLDLTGDQATVSVTPYARRLPPPVDR